MVEMYKIKPFSTNDIPSSGKCPFKTIETMEQSVKHV